MPYIKLSETVVFCRENQLPAKHLLATEEEIAAAGFAPPGAPVAAPQPRRLREQLRWERVTRVDRESAERATGNAWKH